MSNDSYIPLFKRSKDSLTKDVLKLKKLDAITEGWYKGQLIQLLDKIAGKVVIDGIECYKTNIPIDGNTSISNVSEYAKNVRKFLKLLGLDDAALENIYTTSTNSQVEGIQLHFDKNLNKNRKFSEFDFKQTLLNIKEQISNAHRFEIIHSNKHYTSDVTTRPAERMSSIYTGSKWVKDLDFFDSLQDYNEVCNEDGCEDIPIEIIRDFSINQSLHFTEIKIYDNLNTDITSNYPELLINALKVCLAFSSNFAEFQSVTKISEELKKYNDSEDSVYIITSKESYLNNISNDFLDEYNNWKNGSLQVEVEASDNSDGGGTYTTINGIIAMHYWSFFLIIDALDNDESNDLFYISKRKYSFMGKTYYDDSQSVRYINVAGLRRTNAKIIASSFAQYADFRILQKKKKKKFLGIGGFVGSFLGGIFNLVLQFVSLISNVMYYIPQARLFGQFIGWLFSGKWSNDKDRFMQISNRIILAALAIVVTVLTGGSGIQIAISLLMSSYSMYTGLKEYDELVEYSKNIDSKYETSDTDSKLYEKVLDLSNSDEMVEAKKNTIYKPFETINKTYASPFDGNSVYSPKFGL